MGNMLIRNIPDATKAALKKKAKAAGKSVNDVARAALDAAARPSKEEIWAEADRLRERIRKRLGHDLSDSTVDIRADRKAKSPILECHTNY